MMNNRIIYLDYNATTPIDPIVLESMVPYFTQNYANAASSTHLPGRKAAEAVEAARNQVANFLEVETGEIYFTSGASESIYLAITGIYNAFRGFRNKLISTTVEHKAVLNVIDYLEQLGVEVVRLPVDRQGYINLDDLKKELNDNTFLVAVQLANNETGVLQPLDKISEMAHRVGAIVFSDATQAPGKIIFNVHDLGIDCMPLSAHKIYGPKGVGALYVRRKNPRVMLKPLIEGNSENALRLGTLNVPAVVGMGKALEMVKNKNWDEVAKLSKLRTRLEQGIIKDEMGFINGSTRNRISNTTNLNFPGLRASQLIKECPQLAFSLGSACTGNLGKPSYVLKAMGLNEAEAAASIRLSVGRFTTNEDVEMAIGVIREAVLKIRQS